MPNAKVLSEKQAIVAELTEKLKTASSGVLVDYKGITVAQDTALRAGFMDGKVLSLDEIKALAELPSKEVLQAQVLGTMLAPITSLAIVIKAICEQKGGSVEAAEAPAEAAAE